MPLLATKKRNTLKMNLNISASAFRIYKSVYMPKTNAACWLCCKQWIQAAKMAQSNTFLAASTPKAAQTRKKACSCAKRALIATTNPW